MPRRPSLLAVLRLVVLVGAASAGCAKNEPSETASIAVASSPRLDVASSAPVPAAAPPTAPAPDTTAPPPSSPFDPAGSPRWIAAAAGALPELNQVSLEQDIALAAEVLGPGGRLLFGAGPDSPSVQILGPPSPPPPDPVVAALGDLFSPRGGRDVRYRRTRLAHAEPATADNLLAALDHALATGPEPLLLYLGGHGNIGELPRHNTVSLWAQSALSVADLASRLDRSDRPVRLLVTTCFAGGFAELVFRGADEAQGPSPHERCGLFAAPWDLEATGCDPNPDRAAQEGYGLQLLEALRGHDRHGDALPKGELDLDGDGAISLLEAHTRVRIASTSADVPTSTAERWLRHAAPARGPERAVELPEEDAVVRALARRLRLTGREPEAYLELQRIEDDLEAVGRALDQAQLAEEAAYRRAAADLLARWPVLDDPWHPEQPRVLQAHHDAIAAHLRRSSSYLAYLRAREDVEQLSQRSWALRDRAAPYERLTRALDNRKLAARLHARGGEGWATYERILRCERGVP